MDFNTFQQRVSTILGVPYDGEGWRLSLTSDTPAEAKLLLAGIRQWQKELRLLKKEITADLRELRAIYDQQAASVQPSAWSIFGKKGTFRQMAADKKRAIRSDRDHASRKMEEMKQTVDSLLVQLDRAKLHFMEEIDRQKGSS